MNSLSSERISAKAPYRVISAGDGVVRFITDKALVYEAGFIDDYSFMEENCFQFYLKEISGKSASSDPLIMETVWAILEEFFLQNESVVIYICDVSDGRQAVRARIFAKWFGSFEQKEKYTFLQGEVYFQEVGYYASAIVSNSNPDLEDIVSAFNEFRKSVEDKLS